MYITPNCLNICISQSIAWTYVCLARWLEHMYIPPDGLNICISRLMAWPYVYPTRWLEHMYISPDGLNIGYLAWWLKHVYIMPDGLNIYIHTLKDWIHDALARILEKHESMPKAYRTWKSYIRTSRSQWLEQLSQTWCSGSLSHKLPKPIARTTINTRPKALIPKKFHSASQARTPKLSNLPDNGTKTKPNNQES